MLRSVEEFGTACPCLLLQSRRNLRVARREQLQIFRNVLKKRFEVKQTGHSGFSAEDAQEMKIMNRTIMIDVQNVEVTLKAHTKIVEDTLKSMKLVGARGVASPRVTRNEEHTAQLESSEKLAPAESILYRSKMMRMSLKTGLTSLKQDT